MRTNFKYRLVITALLLISSFQGISQPFGNEWINFNQSYYRIRLNNDGFYRLTQSDLLGAGIPLNSFDPRRIQLFHRGVEQAIIIEGEQDGSFDVGDFLEFYGRKNDGQTDTELYVNSTAQPHTLHNLYSDSSAYFFTWNLAPQNGKRATTFFENNVTAIPEEDYHIDQNLILNTSNYSPGKTYSGGNVLLSQFDVGEGWTGSDISKGNNATFTLAGNNNTYTLGPKPKLTLLLTGRNNLDHNVDILVGPNAGSLRLLGNAQFEEHDNFLFDSDIEWSDIDAGGDLVVRVDVLGFGTNTDRVAVSYINLDYPQALNMAAQNSKRFKLVTNPGNKSFIDVSSSPGNIRLYDVTDNNNIIRIGVNQTAAQFDAVIPNTAIERELIAFNTPSASVDIQLVEFNDFNPTAPDYLIITHPDLMTTTSQGEANPIEAYKAYRESAEGGSFKVQIADILKIYDQYNFGEPSPIAIRRFANHMISGGNGPYLFLIGEALDIPNNPDRQTKLALTAQGLTHLVPTMGFPGSDIALTAGLAGTDVVSPVPVGRITAKSPDEVQAYLNKIIEFEQAPFDDLWRKRLIHLSGGTTALELVTFKGNVDLFKAVAEDDFLGGQVATVSKQSSSPIELFNVSEAVNNGVGLITFFGHSGPNGSDIDIGRVSNPSLGYNNQGLYNSIIVNGCNAGDVFGQFFSLGEDWILTPNKGSITYMAHSDNGLSTQLRRYTDQFYQVGYGDSLFISKSIGIIKGETGLRYVNQHSNGPIQKAQVQQFILQGDPATTLFGASLPDYAVTENDISINSFDGEPITALTDSFSVDVIIRNFGTTSKSPLSVTINRFLSEGTIQTFGPQKFDPIKFQDTVSVTVSSQASQDGFGNNRFEVIIDETAEIEEISEINNTASIDFFISSGTTVNIFPKNFGIESNPSVKFITQSSDLIEDRRGFIFELDTTRAFNSGAKVSRSGEFKVLAEWLIELPHTPDDTVVYYWRTKFSEIKEGEEDIYAQSSFTYIPNTTNGWAQSTFDQFDLLVADGLVKDEASNQWDFIETQLSSLIKTHGTTKFPGNPVLYDSLSVFLDNQQILRQNLDEFICRSNTINAIAFDKASLFPYIVFGLTTDGSDPQKCGKTPFIINNITDTEIIGAGLKLNSYIDNIADGDFIMLFSVGELQYENWPIEVINQLNTIGVSTTFLNNLTTGQPVIILGKKGSATGTAIELTGTSAESISLAELITGNFTSGSLTTQRIGPASAWQQFFREASPSEAPSSDTFSYDLIGIDLNSNETTLFSNLGNDNQDISSIDPATYPFIKLAFRTEDETNLTPTQLKKWQVNFTGVPEGILLTNDNLVRRGSTVERSEGGEPLITNYYFKNISKLDFNDSITVDLTSFNMELRESETQQIKIPAIVSDDSAQFSYEIKTLNKSGLNDINVFVNPRILPEVSINNNIIDINNYLNVNRDETNPILDVTFDGVYILDGDIVSPSPRILVKLKDENPFFVQR